MSTVSDTRPTRSGFRRAERRQAAQRTARRRRWVRFGAVALALLLAVAAVLAVSRPWEGEAAIVLPARALPDVPISGRVIGNPAAPVHVLEYGDYQCPGCGFFARELEHRLLAEHVATGRVSFEYRDYAFIGDESARAAEAASCALDQGAFWPYHETLFLNQKGENAGALHAGRLRAMADELGLDTDRFGDCLGEGSHRSEVEAMRQEASNLGVTGTPSFFVNGERVEYRGYESITAAIERELAGGA